MNQRGTIVQNHPGASTTGIATGVTVLVAGIVLFAVYAAGQGAHTFAFLAALVAR